MSDIMQHSIGN